ncbi:hypothetical protein BT69DRAFT_1330588, partial [Atractiella rhizophila]
LPSKTNSIDSPRPEKASNDDDDLPPRISDDELPPRESISAKSPHPIPVVDGGSISDISPSSSSKPHPQSDTPSVETPKPVPIGLDVDRIRAEIARSSSTPSRTQTPPISPARTLFARPNVERAASVPPESNRPLTSPISPVAEENEEPPTRQTMDLNEQAREELRKQWSKPSDSPASSSLFPLQSPRTQASQSSLREAWGGSGGMDDKTTFGLPFARQESVPSIVFGGAAGVMDTPSISFASSDGTLSWDEPKINSLGSYSLTSTSMTMGPSSSFQEAKSGITFGSNDGDIFEQQADRIGWKDKAPDPASTPSWLIKNPANSFSTEAWSNPNDAWGEASINRKKSKNGW